MPYIKTESLLADILDEKIHSKDQKVQIALAYFERMVQRLPTVDVVEVVRCGSCKHFLPQYDTQTGQKLYYGICRLNSNLFQDEEVNRDHYCGYGKPI